MPGKLSLPARVTSAKIDASTASITIKWYEQDLIDTGGVPLTGFKLYMYEQLDESTVVALADATLAFDGTD